MKGVSILTGSGPDQQDAKRFQEHIVTLTKENERLGTQCSEQWIQLDALHVKCGNFEGEIGTLKEKVLRLERKNQDFQQETDHLKTKLRQQQTQISGLESKKQTLEQRSVDNGEEIRNANGKVQSLQQELKIANQENQRLQQEIDSMEKSKSKYRRLVCRCCAPLRGYRTLSAGCFSRVQPMQNPSALFSHV
jgi:chromosome segregation ATPase